MCGIVALVRTAGTAVPTATLPAMTAAVAHRGPDGDGHAYLALAERQPLREVGPEAAWTVALGHRRLAILDLSAAGRQPMCFRGLWISYNGEVYNFLELRRELEREGYEFRTRTDTEVILAAYHSWGTACFERLRGMWGLVLVDPERRRLILSRDRLGIKPLYLWRGDGLVAAVSEIKQLIALPGVRLRANRAAVAEYLATGYEEPGSTFFARVEAVRPGTWRAVDVDTLEVGPEEMFWHPEGVAVAATRPQEAAAALRQVLERSVELHLRSDVPVGCALSGGLDSSSIAALVAARQDSGSNGFHTFSAVFPGDPMNEQPFVDALVQRITATPHSVVPDPDHFLAALDRFVWIHDEPVGHAAQFAAYQVAELARQVGVPVTLNGQGGDEVLAGYWQSYFSFLRGRFTPSGWPTLARALAGSLLPGGNPELVRQVPVMARRYAARRAASEKGRERLRQIVAMSDQERRVFEIREMYLPRLLRWDDRNFMAFSVEGRYPFLDHELIEVALSIAPEALYHAGWVKYPLRLAMDDVLPREICWRRTKLGFETPQAAWLRGGLRPLVESFAAGDSPAWALLDRARVAGLVDAAMQPSTTAEDSGHELFRCLMVDRWMRCFGLS